MARFGFYQEDNEHNRLQIIAGWLVDILVVIALAIFLVEELGNVQKVNGRSMEPALPAGTTVLVNTMTYRLFPVRRYDIVVFSASDESGRTSIKRVVGLPGETVKIAEGSVWIDGEMLADAPYDVQVSIAGLAESPVRLAEGEYFLLGDNGSSSEDSRFANVGNVKDEQILGKVWLKVAPFEEFGPIR